MINPGLADSSRFYTTSNGPQKYFGTPVEWEGYNTTISACPARQEDSMFVARWFLLASGIAAFGFSGMLIGQTDPNLVPPSDSEQQIKFAEPDCPFFGQDREQIGRTSCR